MFVYLSVNSTRATAQAWGDTQYAMGLARAIRRTQGCDCALVFRGEDMPTQAPKGKGPAVVLRLIGPHLAEPVPGLPNMIWMISPPNLAPAGLLRRYQAVFCGSFALTGLMRKAGIGADYLPQATELAQFHPDRRPTGAPDLPLIFVGGYDTGRVDRWLVIEAARAGLEPQIWGPGWQGVVPDRLWRGPHLSYDQLAETYATARVVLNSHMANMAAMGFMSNRSYDALASGAQVISDQVLGFADADLPDLRQVPDAAGLQAALHEMLAGPAPDREARWARHHRLAARHGFGARARQILDRAAKLLAQGAVAPTAMQSVMQTGAAARRRAPVVLTDPAQSAEAVLPAMRAAATEMLAIARHMAQPEAPPLPAPPPAARQGVIHPLMADQRALQQLAQGGPADPSRLEVLVARARRVEEVLASPRPALPLEFHAPPALLDQRLVRAMRNDPLWAHRPEGFDRDTGKISLALWPRQQAPKTPVGVFVHLYYDDLAPVFAERLRHIAAPVSLYVSTDSAEKADRLRAILPGAEIRVLPNRGRDIWPKLYGFRDAHDRHEVVLHLHGKKSPHAAGLNDWLAHNLDCLIGSAGEVSRILSFFETIPRLGMVVPLTFRQVLGAAHWGSNLDLARELAFRLGWPDSALPEDGALRFPVGSMFWARVAAIRPLLDLALTPDHFPPEAGQVDGTLAHAIERMLGVVCQAGGYHLLPVAGAATRLHRGYQRRYASNGALRAALEEGAFHG